MPELDDELRAEVADVLRVVDAMPPRLRMIVLATFTSLRFGELVALARRNVDVSTGLVTVVESQAH